MDSVPQELIDAIIDNLSRDSLCSSSLIAKRWRTRSQRRIFNSIRLLTEDKVNRWHSDIQRGRNRIVPYVHSVELHKISSWNEPTLPGRVLKGFLSLKTLVVHQSAIPDELLAQISRGEFGRGITTLHIRFPLCKLSAIISMIFSLPDLKDLTVSLDQTPPGRLPSTPPVAPKRGPLDRLELYHYGYEKNGITETLIQSRLTFRCLRSTCHLRNILRLFALSSETLVRLEVSATDYSSYIHPPVDLPSFPALESLQISSYDVGLTRCLMSVLSSITSAPALASIEIRWVVSTTSPTEIYGTT